GDRRREAEPLERRRRIDRAAAAAQDELVDEAERPLARELVHRAGDHVGDEDAEADDVHRRKYPTSCGDAARRTCCSSSMHGKAVSLARRALVLLGLLALALAVTAHSSSPH